MPKNKKLKELDTEEQVAIRRERNRAAAARYRRSKRVLVSKLEKEARTWREHYMTLLSTYNHAVQVVIPQQQAEIDRLRALLQPDAV